MAPPQGSVPRRRLSACFLPTTSAWANLLPVKPMASPAYPCVRAFLVARNQPSDAGGYSLRPILPMNASVAAALDISERTVFRAKRRYAEEGLDEVLRHRNQVSRYRKLDDRGEAHLIALACSPAPEGHDHWTLRLLAGTNEGW